MHFNAFHCSGRLMCAFDSTYLTSSLGQLKLRNTVAMVGGVFCHETPSNCFAPISEALDCASIRKAASMLEFLVWSPSAKKKTPLSICSVPVETNFAGANSTFRGNVYLMRCVGDVLDKSDGMILGLIFDQAGSHQFVRRFVHAQMEGLPLEEIRDMPFWRDLSFKDIDHPLPRLPIGLCFYKEEIFWAIPGVCNQESLAIVWQYCVF